MAQEQHVRAAIDAADAAKEAWSKTPPAERERILFRAADELERAMPELVELLIDEGRENIRRQMLRRLSERQ